jgi:hypothetical protein
MVRKTPLTLMTNTSSNSDSGESPIGANFATPALANNMSIFPNASSTFEKKASTSAGFETSERMASVSPPILLCRSEGAPVAPRDSDLCSFLVEQLRRGQTDAAVAACDDGDFSFKLFHCV